jgi:GNAT acetyltransferase-like protein/peptidoglycan biosynthesis/recognition FemAB-like protein
MAFAVKAENGHAEVLSREVGGHLATGHFSHELADPAWDAFLESTPLGHFQQSSLWARAKSIEGWRPIRMVLKLDGQVSGGFQILCRRTHFGQIGYISKGPVIVSDTAPLIDFMCELVRYTIKANNLLALVVQPPDEFVGNDSFLARQGFLANHLVDVISATLLVDLPCGMDEIGRRIRKSTQADISRAKRRGIKIREGDERDIGAFFRLMLATCERQKARPVPATEAGLLEVWKAFRSRGGVRLSIAEYDGEPIAGALCLAFGERVTLWKKGWSGQHRERHPNPLLTFEAVQWSHRNGYKLFDFAALSPNIATTLLRGEPLSEKQKNSRDFFDLSFGNRPILLPPTQIYITNPVARSVYQRVVASSALCALARRLVRIGQNGRSAH